MSLFLIWIQLSVNPPFPSFSPCPYPMQNFFRSGGGALFLRGQRRNCPPPPLSFLEKGRFLGHECEDDPFLGGTSRGLPFFPSFPKRQNQIFLSVCISVTPPSRKSTSPPPPPPSKASEKKIPPPLFHWGSNRIHLFRRTR